jgi:hypothetical protein
MLKAPLRPPERPIAPDPNNKKILPDENGWLWEAYEQIKENLEEAIKPLNEYVETFSVFENENKLNPDKYVKEMDECENPPSVEEIKADIHNHMNEEKRISDTILNNINVSIF